MNLILFLIFPWNSKNSVTKMPHYILSVNKRFISYSWNSLWKHSFLEANYVTQLLLLPCTLWRQCPIHCQFTKSKYFSSLRILLLSFSLSYFLYFSQLEILNQAQILDPGLAPNLCSCPFSMCLPMKVPLSPFWACLNAIAFLKFT